MGWKTKTAFVLGVICLSAGVAVLVKAGNRVEKTIGIITTSLGGMLVGGGVTSICRNLWGWAFDRSSEADQGEDFQVVVSGGETGTIPFSVENEPDMPPSPTTFVASERGRSSSTNSVEAGDTITNHSRVRRLSWCQTQFLKRPTQKRRVSSDGAEHAGSFTQEGFVLPTIGEENDRFNRSKSSHAELILTTGASSGSYTPRTGGN